MKIIIVGILLLPSIVLADCFERFYTQAHLNKHKGKQEVRNISMSWDFDEWDDATSTSTGKIRLQMQLIRNGKVRVAEATASCDSDYQYYNSSFTSSCTFDAPLQGTVSFKASEKNGQKRVIGKLKSATFFEKTKGVKVGTQMQIDPYDNSFMVFYNDQSFYKKCDGNYFLPNTVSTTRLWNEVILDSVRNDLARPTVTARNLFHLSALMWDVYSSYDSKKTAYFVQKSAPASSDIAVDRERALSYAAYTFLKKRYERAPGNVNDVNEEFGDGIPDNHINKFLDSAMQKLFLKPANKQSKSLSKHANFGIEMAELTLARHKNDGSREDENHSYDPSYNLVNNMGLLDVSRSGIRTNSEYDYQTNTETPSREFADEVNIDFWIPLYVPGAVDQGGNGQAAVQSPLTLYWGRLPTFGNLEPYKSPNKDGVYFDPGEFLPLFTEKPDEVIRKNLEVVEYSALLSPVDLVAAQKDFDRDGRYDVNPGAEYMDISPGSYGNNTLGTNDGQGRPLNPVTQKAYKSEMVRKADFYRSLAEFWADGPQSETPPGHWNTLANYVLDQMVELKIPYQWKGQGPNLDQQEYELKLYLTLNGALNDAAVVAWGIKSHYQGNRPIMVIRKLAAMAEKDPAFAQQLTSEYPFLKMVTFESEVMDRNTGKMISLGMVTKLAVKAWRGQYYVDGDVNAGFPNYSYRTRDSVAEDEDSFYNYDSHGVGWILAENWIPYQRPSFVTPPFPGFVSGHSTFSRAAAEVLSGVTGSTFFPGGLGTYPAPPLHFEGNNFQAFEFQWATYYDAADQSGISRLYGGIHASYDDLPARKIGSQVGKEAVKAADQFFAQ